LDLHFIIVSAYLNTTISFLPGILTNNENAALVFYSLAVLNLFK